MRQKRGRKQTVEPVDLLKAVPVANEAMETDYRGDGTVLVSVPMRRPKWLAPPISWLLPYSSHRRVELDRPGAQVLKMCDGKRTVERIIEEFAAMHKLTFRESHLAVTQFLRMLTERGVIAVVVRQRKRR